MKFTVEYHTVWGESLALVAGGVKHPMTWNPGGLWTVELPKAPAEYGYVVLRDGRIVRSEWQNHKAPKSACKEIRDSWIDCPVPGCPFAREHSFAAFDKPGFKGAGTAIPVFSLRSTKDFGVGEFLDIIPMVDWMAATGQTVLQLLPINDTTRSHTWEDSYPYNPVTSFGLHPQYLNLRAAGVPATPEYKRLQKELNALEQIDYERVNDTKERLLREHFAGEGRADLQTPAYKKFYRDNSFWLDSYAAFCLKRDSARGESSAIPGSIAAKQGVEFYCWEQYHLDKQLAKACKYARGKGVALKGDLPIGVSSDSVDASEHPELFNLDSQAGAPPDYFSADGQNWGFPTYNWEAMARDDYAWWKARLRKMSEYFDAFRIDHILGFFRIWEIPVPHKSGMMGHFNPAMPYPREEISRRGLPLQGLFLEDPRTPGMYHPCISPDKSALSPQQRADFEALYNDFFYHRHNSFWKVNAERKLPELLTATGMLACGEDLGMIPDCVPEVMGENRILSLEMQRMPKESWLEFGRPENNPYLSVCATSSHDMMPLRMWWELEMDPGARARFWYDYLGRGGSVPETLEPDACEQIVTWHLYSPSMLAILPLQDWTAISASVRSPKPLEERINEPAESRHYWRYRMHLTVEDLCGRSAFNEHVRELITASGR